jgi:predicted kinase
MPIVSPDSYLYTETGEYVFSPERASAAWGSSYRDLKTFLKNPKIVRVVLMIGIPGSGKSSWLKTNYRSDTVFFDATFTTVRSRAPVIQMAREAGRSVMAVVMDTPVGVCLDRNSCRTTDRQVPAEAIQRMNAQLLGNPPQEAEGLDHIVHVRMKSAARWTLDTAQIEKLRKEFLQLAKSTEKVTQPDQVELLYRAWIKWRSHYESFGMTLREVLESAQRQSPQEYPHIPYLLKDMDQFWGMHSEIGSFPEYRKLQSETPDQIKARLWDYFKGRYPTDETRARNEWENYIRKLPTEAENTAANMAAWHETSRKWLTRVRTKARTAWKYLDQITGLTSKLPTLPKYQVDTRETLQLEGFHLVFFNYDTSGEPDLLESVKDGLRLYRERAQKTFPILLKKQLPIAIDWNFRPGAPSFAAAYYTTREIRVTPWGLTNKSLQFVKTMAHEMSHHLWRTYMSGEAKDDWETYLKGTKTTLDLRDALKRLHELGVRYMDDSKLEQQDPILALQLQSLNFNPATKAMDFISVSDLETYLQDGGNPHAPVSTLPITGYAGKNAEEAFCEAVGLLVAFGPQTVLPPIRRMLMNLFPNLRLAADRGFVEYYDTKQGQLSLMEIIDRWQKENKKLYDRSMPLFFPTRLLWPLREYTWSRETSRSGYAEFGREAVLLSGELKWDALKEVLRIKGWDPVDPLLLIIGQEGGVKVGEGNHRLALAMELGLPQVPVRFLFYTNRVTKSRQEPEPEVVKAPPAVFKKVIEHANPNEEGVDELMDLLFNKYTRKLAKRAAANPIVLTATLLDWMETVMDEFLEIDAPQSLRKGFKTVHTLLQRVQSELRKGNTLEAVSMLDPDNLRLPYLIASKQWDQLRKHLDTLLNTLYENL